MSSELEKRFHTPMEQLGKMHERSKVYVDFMDYYIYQNSDSPERTLPNGYTDKEMKLFSEAYNSFTELMKELIEKHGWYDYIGEYYEEYILAGSKASSKGQFYTPRAISDLLSQVVGAQVYLDEAYDPACGSARNLLDYHSKYPDVRCTGEDLDESACKMAVVNFHCHGVDGVVNWIDALTREYMGTSWRILGGSIYITDMDWIRANNDVLNAVNILMLSDSAIEELVRRLIKSSNIQEDCDDKSVIPKEVFEAPNVDNQSTVENVTKQNKKGGLDDWL